ncbi:MAG: beta-propeller domain-containing protein [Tepidanaerobacteraceae bacterium]|nr:beta-propeller domain-containing protein [Tepidanaerobacteraceae bacterium]
MKRLRSFGFISVILLLSALVAFSFMNTNMAFSSSVDSNIEKEDLPVVGSYEKLKELLAQTQTVPIYDDFATREMAVPIAPTMQKTNEAGAMPSKDSIDYSGTNVQVEGVDEADLIKTDGKYIYQVNRGKVIVVEAFPVSNMNIVNTLDFQDEGFTPQELYLDENFLVVIGSTYKQIPFFPSENKTPDIYPPRYSCSTVRAIIYDICRKTDIKKLREVELEGNYVASRKINSSLYLVVNKGINCSMLEDGIENPTPSYRDTAVKDDFENIKYDKIRYFPKCLKPNYLIAAGLNLDEMDKEVNVYTLLGAGENIYSSPENLYVSLADNRCVEPEPQPVMPSSGIKKHIASDYSIYTQIYKFTLNRGQISFNSNGEVPGNLLNQFSLDEHEGYFRIATTTGFIWRSYDNISKNNVYILDKDLKIIGSLEGIAPGEKIYSVRFMGDKGYMVTFKTVDPLFVIDLKDPCNPTILGALKIPGYSDYIHPYDENHIIGFGKDTIEIEQKDMYGNTFGTTAFYLGMKIALFDVSDVHNPIEKFTIKIGDRGTDSELLRNHKALLFSKEKQLMAFPVTVMETQNKQKSGNSFPEYGKFAFQGAYVYNIDLVKGIVLKGRITHLSEEDYLKAGNYWYSSNKNVERILYIDDVLYTLSNSMIKANRMSDLTQLNVIQIPE